MNTLVRTRSGSFTLDECNSVSELRDLKEKIETWLIPTDKIFSLYEKIKLNNKKAQLVTNGIKLAFSGLCEGEFYRLYDENDKFLCISKYIEGKLVLEKAFWA